MQCSAWHHGHGLGRGPGFLLRLPPREEEDRDDGEAEALPPLPAAWIGDEEAAAAAAAAAACPAPRAAPKVASLGIRLRKKPDCGAAAIGVGALPEEAGTPRGASPDAMDAAGGAVA